MFYMSLESTGRERSCGIFQFRIGGKFLLNVSWTWDEIVQKSRCHKVLGVVGPPCLYDTTQH